jgi:hypothetical protein
MRLLAEKWQYLILSPSTMAFGKHGIPPELLVAASDEQLVTREMFMFLIFKKLRYGILEDSIMLVDEQRICDRFSEWVNLHPSHGLKTGDILGCEGRIIRTCWLKKGQDKLQIHVIRDQLMFIMVTPLKEDNKKGQILFVDQLKYIEMCVDRSNPRAMVIASANKVFFPKTRLKKIESEPCDIL